MAETIDTLTITERIQFESSDGLILSNNPLTIASPNLFLDSQVRISNGFNLSGPIEVEGTVQLEGALDVKGKIHIRSREGETTPGLQSFNGAVLNGLGIGLGGGHGVTIDVPAQPWSQDTISTLSQASDLHLYSYKNICFHTKDPSVTKMSLDQNGNLTITGNLITKGTLQVSKNITFDNGLTVDTTFKNSSGDGYGGTPTAPGPRNPITILNGLNNSNSLVIEIDGSSSSAGKLVLWWKSNGQKFKAELVGIPV